MSGFLQPEIVPARGSFAVTTTHGDTYYVPSDVREPGDSLSDYRPEFALGEVETVETLTTGYLCRLSASGYVDCTDWGWAPTKRAARALLRDTDA